jgi:MOSC domain-containing protein
MIMKMHVAELWRYPVKSLAGEPLDSAEISADGIPGDCVVQVYDAEGRFLTALKKELKG